jgi:uncharacterized membrane protein YgcG
MFNERNCYIQQRIVAGTWRFCLAQFGIPAPEEAMASVVIAFGIAIGIALLMCHRVMKRLPKRRVINGSSADRSGPMDDNDASGTGNHFAWSVDENSAFEHSDAAGDSGGGDGSGDAGGGADGRGGGSD